MKTILIMYMPGHAGHLIARLFGLSPEVMPLINKGLLERLINNKLGIPKGFDKLALYKFSDVKTKFESWQDFHRAYANYKDNAEFKMLDEYGKHQHSAIIYPVHPYEFHFDYDNSDCNFYYVDLDLDQWGSWVEQEQQKLGFVVRPDELDYFNKYKTMYNMKPISLTKLLGQDFDSEYQRVATDMNITPVMDKAHALFQDWKSVRL